MILSLICTIFLNAWNPADTTNMLQLKESFSGRDATGYYIVIRIDLPGNCSGKPLRLSRKGWDGGHCAVELVQVGRGHTVSHTVGFYPYSGINSFNIYKDQQSAIRDDSRRDFDFSLLITTDSLAFMNAVDSVVKLREKPFNLFTFNCVDFCLSVLRSSINLDIKKDFVIGGSLYTPYTLRQSLLTLGKLPRGSRVLSDCFDAKRMRVSSCD
jgi:hypothetical protein